jgi:hypothetical protein
MYEKCRKLNIKKIDIVVSLTRLCQVFGNFVFEFETIHNRKQFLDQRSRGEKSRETIPCSFYFTGGGGVRVELDQICSTLIEKCYIQNFLLKKCYV